MRFIFLLTPGLWHDLRDALRFLTRLPIPGKGAGRDLNEALGAFPLAGAVIGLILVAIDIVLAFIHVPPLGRDALVVAAWCWLTGGMHLDGLMTVGDALFVPRMAEGFEYARGEERSPYGVTGALLDLLLKFALLSALQGGIRIEALIVAPMLGRWSLVLAATLFPPAGAEIIGMRRINPLRVATAAGTTLALAPLAGINGMVALILCSVATWRLGRILSARLPDRTGAIYGALVEVSEVIMLLVCTLGVTGLWSSF
ncbi:MAG TPA: adenosylcobinamide-GDP ribazoletransferase [Chloroflexota bacterium]|nr:adenosylcobinamide-GDP ribazoletransferase [Chloroflexota bacterium]